ncbi:MAG: hypothetical protein KDA41_17895, partial [Planctomycetales bacterium]|nr:hypothetical protein [Planctomycetales bacterium]
GPGWLESTRRGGAKLASGSPATPGAAPFATTDDDKLTFLHVDFQQRLTGNLHDRHVQLHEDVRAVYGPVDDWNQRRTADDIDTAPNLVLLSSDALQVAETAGLAPGDNENGASFELQALGNAMVEGKTFTARAHRLAYAQAKDLLVIEGDGRTDAELFRQAQAGGAAGRAAARKILYWPSTGRMDVDTFRSLDWAGPVGPDAGASPIPSGVGQFLQNERQRQTPIYSTAPR